MFLSIQFSKDPWIFLGPTRVSNDSKGAYDPVATQRERQDRLRRMCRKYNLGDQTLKEHRLQNLYVDDKRRFMACLVSTGIRFIKAAYNVFHHREGRSRNSQKPLFQNMPFQLICF